MLSAAKHLYRWAEMLRCAQHDKQGDDKQGADWAATETLYGR